MSIPVHCKPVLLAREAIFQVGIVEVEPARCLLRGDAGREQTVEPRVMQVLVALYRAEGEVVAREDLIASCWDGRTVSRDATNRVISILRNLAQDIGQESFRIETLSKVGYRLVAPAPVGASAPPEPVSAPPPIAMRKPHRISRRTALAMAGVVGLGAMGWAARRFAPWKPGDLWGDRRDEVILVLPFENLAAAPEMMSMAQGATEAMRQDLDRVPGLRVVGAAESRNVARDGLAAVISRTGADLVAGASLDQLGDGMRLTMTLSNASDGRQLWSGIVKEVVGSPFDLQRDAAGMMIEQLVLRLPASPVDPTNASMRRDPEAYRLAQQARSMCDDVRELLLAGDTEGAQHRADDAAALLERSLVIDPENPDALAILADLARNGWSRKFAATSLTTQQRVEQANVYLRRALRSDPTSAAAMTRLADIYRRFGWRWDDAETLFRHALANDPANIDAHWAYSHELATLGRARDALDHALTLWSLDSTHLWRRIDLPRMLLFYGLRAKAMFAYERELRRAPANSYLLYELYYLHVAKRDAKGLSNLLGTIDDIWKGREHPANVSIIEKRCQAAMAAMSGSPGGLLAILDEERTAFEAGGLTRATLGGRARDDIGFILAIEYACAGQYDRAITLLDQALQAMSVYWLACLPYGDSPFPEPMHRDPRFAALWSRDPRLADAVERRRLAVAEGQMAGVKDDDPKQAMPVPSGFERRILTALS